MACDQCQKLAVLEFHVGSDKFSMRAQNNSVTPKQFNEGPGWCRECPKTIPWVSRTIQWGCQTIQRGALNYSGCNEGSELFDGGTAQFSEGTGWLGPLGHQTIVWGIWVVPWRPKTEGAAVDNMKGCGGVVLGIFNSVSLLYSLKVKAPFECHLSAAI